MAAGWRRCGGTGTCESGVGTFDSDVSRPNTGHTTGWELLSPPCNCCPLNDLAASSVGTPLPLVAGLPHHIAMRNLIAQFAQDLRFAGRHIAKTKTTTLTMVAVLSFGGVVNAALVGVVHAVTSRPAPGITPDDALVRVRSARLFSYPELSELAAQRQAFDAVAGFATEPLPIDAASLGGKAEGPLSNVFFVTHDYFRVLGLQVTGGAGLPTDSAVNRFANPVAVISHAMWTDELGGRADVVGRSIRVNDVPTTIVGVAPPRFIGVDGGRQTRAVWMPVGAARAVANWGDPTISYDSLRFNVVARLRADASMASATPLATSIVKQADTRLTRPRGPAGLRPPQIVPLRALNNGSGADAKFLKDARPLTVLTVLVLLITCAAVGRSAHRRKPYSQRRSHAGCVGGRVRGGNRGRDHAAVLVGAGASRDPHQCRRGSEKLRRGRPGACAIAKHLCRCAGRLVATAVAHRGHACLVLSHGCGVDETVAGGRPGAERQARARE
jgi:hypothetical protein